jgi:hypothetical protein
MQPNSGSCADPVYVCNDSSRCASITGGVIVDSCAWPDDMRNRYYFGDLWGGRIYSLAITEDRLGIQGARNDVVNTGGDNSGPMHITLGPDGNVYYSTLLDGSIMKLAPQSPIVCEEEPTNNGGAGGEAGASSVGGQPEGGATGIGGAAGSTRGGSESESGGGKAGSPTAASEAPPPYDVSGCVCSSGKSSGTNTLLAIITGVAAGVVLRLRHRRRQTVS